MIKKHLHIPWTNADPLTANLMVVVYATTAMLNPWREKVTAIIWGATTKLAAENRSVQVKIRQTQQAEVTFSACIACAAQLGIEEKFRTLDIETKSWGQPLAELLAEEDALLSI